MTALARLLLFAGAGGVIVSALLPWVTVGAIPLRLDLGLVGASVTPGGRTVSGTDTSVWPALAVVAGIVAVLTALNLAHRLLAVVGLLVVLAGAGLLYYVGNVIEIESSKHGALAEFLARSVLHSSSGPGPAVLLASGVAIVLGGLAGSGRPRS